MFGKCRSGAVGFSLMVCFLFMENSCNIKLEVSANFVKFPTNAGRIVRHYALTCSLFCNRDGRIAKHDTDADALLSAKKSKDGYP